MLCQCILLTWNPIYSLLALEDELEELVDELGDLRPEREDLVDEEL